MTSASEEMSGEILLSELVRAVRAFGANPAQEVCRWVSALSWSAVWRCSCGCGQGCGWMGCHAAQAQHPPHMGWHKQGGKVGCILEFCSKTRCFSTSAYNWCSFTGFEAQVCLLPLLLYGCACRHAKWGGRYPWLRKFNRDTCTGDCFLGNWFGFDALGYVWQKENAIQVGFWGQGWEEYLACVWSNIRRKIFKLWIKKLPERGKFI